MALVGSNHEEIKAGDDASAAKWFDISFKESGDEWILCLTHEEDKICARLKETTSQWDVKRKFVTVESNDIAFDHQLIIADAIIQLRKWITETHIAFRLLPEKFTLRELQQIHESVLDTKLLVPAFRRKVSSLVEDTGEMTGEAGHRPAVLYREKYREKTEMNRMLIVGNGFDLEHGLKTTYWDFREYLEENHLDF